MIWLVAYIGCIFWRITEASTFIWDVLIPFAGCVLVGSVWSTQPMAPTLSLALTVISRVSMTG